ncbi:MAG TPA: efflux RND transporter periplasmic adaptor subunit [Terriglobales bacterium]|jgi:HlyD family secretion protein|nr:efflux RND transporter periplasmic adaptor subunit [Terriglobales bacterium]
MKTWKKIAIGVGVAVLLLAVVGYFVARSQRDVVKVQTGKAVRQSLASVVSASGEIKPKTYVNIGANAFGKITRLYVHEGDRVKRGQLLAQLENVQSSADVAATRASLEAAQTDTVAADAAMKTAIADLKRARSDAERTKLDYDRAEGLYKAALIAKAEYDARKAAYEAAAAGEAQAQARIAQAKAQKDSSERRITQSRANLTRVSDVLQKTTYAAPFDGVITNLPVREGETVVIGIQNSPGSTLMTLADMSVITSEVKVDETDIVNVKLGQSADVTIDAIPRRIFHGVVSEIGNNAIVRSTGVATSQQATASQEAKDFKVVVTVQDPPQDLRPGLSSTAKITTASRENVLTIPIQALTIRANADLEKARQENGAVQAATPTGTTKEKKAEEVQGVFVIRNKKAEFVPVETGISGTTDVEVLNGLREGDEIITGSYKVLRTLKPGASVKIDNSVPKKAEDSGS